MRRAAKGPPDAARRDQVIAKIEVARGVARAARPECAPLDATPPTPCASCPYRQDVPVGVWHAENFERLVRADRDPLGGGVFGCHLDDGTLCRGWFLDQRARGFPSLRLRLRLALHDPHGRLLDLVNDGGHALYPSIDALCRANGVDPAKVR